MDVLIDGDGWRNGGVTNEKIMCQCVWLEQRGPSGRRWGEIELVSMVLSQVWIDWVQHVVRQGEIADGREIHDGFTSQFPPKSGFYQVKSVIWRMSLKTPPHCIIIHLCLVYSGLLFLILMYMIAVRVCTHLSDSGKCDSHCYCRDNDTWQHSFSSSGNRPFCRCLSPMLCNMCVDDIFLVCYFLTGTFGKKRLKWQKQWHLICIVEDCVPRFGGLFSDWVIQQGGVSKCITQCHLLAISCEQCSTPFHHKEKSEVSRSGCLQG